MKTRCVPRLGIVFFILLFTPCRKEGRAEVVTLADGRQIVCKVVREEGGRVWVRTHAALMPLERSQIVSIESGPTDAALIQRLEQAEHEAKTLLSRGEIAAARRRLEFELWKLDQELGANDKPSEKLLATRQRLRNLNYAAMRNDPDQRKAQEIYEQALERIDRIDYPGAYDLLVRAASLAPDRLDIQLDLGETAGILNKPQVAIRAYGVIFANGPAEYYSVASRPYLDGLLRYGRRALLEDRPREALPYYEQIILIQAQEGNDPLKVEEFTKRQNRRLTQTRLEVMLDIFEYARPREMIDLAKAALEAALESDPDNVELARNYEIWRFLSLLKSLVEKGLKDDIVRLKAETPAWVLEDAEVRAYLSRFEADSGELLKARAILDEAERHLAAGNYGDAERFAQTILDSYADTPFVERARGIIAQCRLELAINEALEKAIALIDEMKLDEADALLQQTLAMDGVLNANGFEKLEEFARRMAREREAAELWNRASIALSIDDIDTGSALLETLSNEYMQTQYGRHAARWLAENRGLLERRGFVVESMSKGVASIILDGPAAGSATKNDSKQRLFSISSLDALLQADEQQRGTDWLLVIQVVVPIFLSLFILMLLLRKVVWPGGDRFGLSLEKYFEARRFRADPWGTSEEITGISVDLSGLEEESRLDTLADLFGSGGEAEDTTKNSPEGAADAPTMQPEPVEMMRERILPGPDRPTELLDPVDPD